jgi:SAM-dependent methyltransferase
MVVVCRASIHHTKEPRRTFENLASVLGPSGRIAISAYARKGNLREATDDGLRNVIKPLAATDALKVGRELALLGKALKRTQAAVVIEENLEWLGIKAGHYPLQGLIYDHLLKSWGSDDFGEDYSAVVNYDWYHPTYAYRYAMGELEAWFDESHIALNHSHSTIFQHFPDGTRKA